MSAEDLLASCHEIVESLIHSPLSVLVSENESIVILEISKELSEECRKWLLNLLTASVEDGGVELQVRQLVEYDKNIVYHVGADMKRLIEAAELMRLKKRYADDTVRDFNVEQFFLFVGTDDIDTIFSSKEKQEIVLHEIQSIRYNKGMQDTPRELPSFYEDQAIFPSLKHKQRLDFFPMHEKKQLKELNKKWITNFFHHQPLDLINNYFGDSISFYFAFLGFYTKWLFVPAILGLLFQLLSFYFHNSIVAVFCIFNIIWTSIFLVLWKRKSSELAFRWGSAKFSKFDEPRAEFRGTTRVQNAITGRVELFCNPRSKYYRFYFVSLPIIFFALAVCVLLGILYFWVDDWVMDAFNYADPPTRNTVTWAGTFLSILVTCFYGAIVYFVDLVYRKVAFKLNEYENHRLQSTYDNFLIVKLVVFNCVNYFFSLFYVAFYLQDFQMLSKDLATLLITWQVIQQFQEALLPYVAYKMKKRKTLEQMQRYIKKVEETDKQTNKKDDDDDDAVRGHDDDRDGGRDDDAAGAKESVIGGCKIDLVDVYQVGKDTTKEEYLGTLDDFLELYVQFGYVFLFSAVFPTAAFWAFLNNLSEIRVDGFKLCYIHRRPFVVHCDGIGAWLTAFELMGLMAVVTNCALVALSPTTQDFLVSRGWQSFQILVLFVIVEHILLFMKATISTLVPSTPAWVKTKMDKVEYDTTAIWRKKRSAKLRSNHGSLIDKKLQ